MTYLELIFGILTYLELIFGMLFNYFLIDTCIILMSFYWCWFVNRNDRLIHILIIVLTYTNGAYQNETSKLFSPFWRVTTGERWVQEGTCR